MSFLLAILWALLAIPLLVFAWKREFFSMPHKGHFWEVPIRWFHVAGAFSIYFVTTLFIARFIATYLRSASGVALAVWVNFLASSLILIALLFFCLKFVRPVFFKIWRFASMPDLFSDFKTALLTLALALPLVICMDEGWNLILLHGFHIENLPDQLAVRFVKMTFEHPLYFFFSALTIIGLAPVVEELLFRGFFQSFLRQYLGSRWAIVGTAICFSFFHYSSEQGVSNIPIISSLLVLALFLGFIYEKRRSLAASVLLHAAFNATNVMNLYFFG